MKYTLSQQEAIETIDQNLQIIACAGSGKTQVISARIVEILAQGVAPGQIVAFTFTEKAAGELKDRIDQLCLERLGSNQGLGEMFVGTIHGYCLNLLQSPPLYRYLKYTILDEVRQRLLIDRYSAQSGLTQTPLLNGHGTLQRWRDSRLFQDLISIYTEADLRQAGVPTRVHQAIAQYRQLMHQHHYLDYSMIIAEAVEAIQTNAQLRQQLADQVQYLVVDEYQDVNPLQENLIEALHELGANLCVVGDDDQTIYQWRGSDVHNILTFAQRYANVKQIRLNENFRSSNGIIESAREVVEINDPDRLAKKMESTNVQHFQYGDVLALSFDDPDREAEWIARKIKQLYGTEYRDWPDRKPRGLTYGDFAILLRSVKNDAGPIVAVLERADIPHFTGGINRLFDTPEAWALVTVFYYLAEFVPRGEQYPPIEDDIAEALERAGLGLSAAQIESGIDLLNERKAYIQQDRRDALIYLQRVYLDFLEALELREESIPVRGARTGEIIFYNLGKFSQVISDYENINFHSSPQHIYDGFANFLCYQAPDYYPEGWEEAGYAQLDAVQILTVHKAKGMQWPAVFVPCLRNNRFPSKRQGGRQVWHIIPEEAVPNAERYKGTVEDERRLFHVATTRAERYLFCSYSPVPVNRLYNKVSTFQLELTRSSCVLSTEPPQLCRLPKATPTPRREEISLPLTFSEIKYFFECPYLFKLRFLYGFDSPVSRALGYGKSLHDALAQIHAECLNGNIPTEADVPDLVDEHLHLPFANQQVRDNLERAATKALSSYLRRNHSLLDKIQHVEKMIELKLSDGIVVNGRIDLIRRTDTNETIIVDFKSTDRTQAEEITRQQLQIYALGYEQLTGTRANLIEIHNLDAGGVHREMIDQQLITDTTNQIKRAGDSLRNNHLPRLKTWCETCDDCDQAGICRTPPA
jgi:DNA helicase-2/ATP-dependent DNA helicase PcrA